MQKKCGLFMIRLFARSLCKIIGSHSRRKIVLKIFLRGVQRFPRCLWLGLPQVLIVCLVERDTFSGDLDEEDAPMRERARTYLEDPSLVKNIIADGCERAKRLAAETLRDVREAMGLSYP